MGKLKLFFKTLGVVAVVYLVSVTDDAQKEKWRKFKVDNNCKMIEYSEYNGGTKFNCNGVIYTGRRN